MKRRVFSVMATCCFLALGAGASAHAQLPGTTLRAMIPFDFSVRGKLLAAGEYEIRRITDSPYDGLVISSVNDKHERVMFETEPVEARRISSQSKIVFHRYGDSYFMSEIFPGGDQTGSELFTSRQEHILRREMASSKGEPETVAAY